MQQQTKTPDGYYTQHGSSDGTPFYSNNNTNFHATWYGKLFFELQIANDGKHETIALMATGKIYLKNKTTNEKEAQDAIN